LLQSIRKQEAAINKHLEESIRKEIRDWSKHSLEKANENYNGFPPCPYAAKAWIDNKVDIQFKYDLSPEKLYENISHYNDKYELIILVDLEYELEPDRFHGYLEGINEAISNNAFQDKDIYVMGFHPEDDTNEIIESDSFETEVDDVYSMIFIQRLSLLERASEKLRSKGYYDRTYGNYKVDEILQKRNKLFRRLTWQKEQRKRA
jgi:hypothetical protein|tara:strand:+ start:189 stop:803 length:615 start_codon:yes stop_codon:yes gene_type:complete